MSKCPICKRNVGEDAPAPFCSQRCADVDLGRWVMGSYAIPAGASSEDDPDAVLDAPRGSEEIDETR